MITKEPKLRASTTRIKFSEYATILRLHWQEKKPTKEISAMFPHLPPNLITGILFGSGMVNITERIVPDYEPKQDNGIECPLERIEVNQ